MKVIQKYAWIGGMCFIFGIFFYITSKSPLAGDDWGYALNGLLYNPFELAFKFYMTWSGRFFSELYGFLVAPNHSVWNVLNPTLFALIFFLILKIALKKMTLLSVLTTVFLMLAVKNELRMETYTWLMGTTYVIPLCLSLFYLYTMKTYVIDQIRPSTLRKAVLFPVMLVIGMSMENISIVIFLVTLAIIVYHYIKNKEIDAWLVSLSITSLLALLLLRFSPGAQFRLQRDHVEWLKLNLFEQLVKNYPNFIRFTFIEHRYLIMALSVLMISIVIKKMFKDVQFRIGPASSILVFGLAVVVSASLTLSTKFPSQLWTILLDPASLFNLVFWPLYILAVYAILWTHLSSNRLTLAILFVTLAGLANGVMMLSPIFSYRSSLYTVYFLIIVCLVLLQEIEGKVLNPILVILMTLLIARTSYGYYIKYQDVAKIDAIRQAEIQYYVDHPEIKEAWFIRYPVYSIHSGDIEEGDDYHMDVFRRYYGLANDVRLIFYNHD